MTLRKELKHGLSPALRLAILSMIFCGLVFPLVITGIAEALFPYQANGSIATLNNRKVASNLIAQDFTNDTKGIFFHPRPSNMSASGVDPDVTLQDALSQIPRISGATGISVDSLKQLVNQNLQHTFFIIGDPYVNIVRLNLVLIQTFPGVYARFP